MGTGFAILLLLTVGVVAANLPWISDRLLFVLPLERGKAVRIRLLEWFLMYGLFLLAGLGLERAVDGGLHRQTWIFYAVTVCIFAVFAAPGVIWRKDLRPLLRGR